MINKQLHRYIATSLKYKWKLNNPEGDIEEFKKAFLGIFTNSYLNNDNIKKINAELISNPDYNEYLYDYIRSWALFTRNITLRKYYIRLYSEFDKPKTKISKNSIYKFHLKYRSDSKLLKRKYEDLNRIKIPKINFKDIGEFISIISILFLLSGFIYCNVFLKYFSINSQDYFNLSDYLASSINNIKDASIAVIIAVGSFLLGIYNRLNKNQISVDHIDDKYPNRIVLIGTIFSYIFLIFAIINSILRNGFQYELYFLSITLLTLRYIPDFTTKYFEEHIKWTITLSFLIIFYLKIFTSMGNEIYIIKNGIDNNNLNIEFTDSNLDYLNNNKLILSNSNFLFLYDSISKKTTVINKSFILKIEQDEFKSYFHYLLSNESRKKQLPTRQ